PPYLRIALPRLSSPLSRRWLPSPSSPPPAALPPPQLPCAAAHDWAEPISRRPRRKKNRDAKAFAVRQLTVRFHAAGTGLCPRPFGRKDPLAASAAGCLAAEPFPALRPRRAQPAAIQPGRSE